MRESKSQQRRQAWLERKRIKARAEMERTERIEREGLERERAVEAQSRCEEFERKSLEAMQRRQQIERAHEAPVTPIPPQRRRLGHGLGARSIAASMALLALNSGYLTPAADPLFCGTCGGAPCCCRDKAGRRHG